MIDFVVTITQPATQHVVDVGDTVEVVTEASDSDGVVTAVTFHIVGRRMGRDSIAPYEYSWNTESESGFYHMVRYVLPAVGADSHQRSS